MADGIGNNVPILGSILKIASDFAEKLPDKILALTTPKADPPIPLGGRNLQNLSSPKSAITKACGLPQDTDIAINLLAPIPREFVEKIKIQVADLYFSNYKGDLGEALQKVKEEGKPIIFITPDNNALLLYKEKGAVKKAEIGIYEGGYICGTQTYKTLSSLKEEAPQFLITTDYNSIKDNQALLMGEPENIAPTLENREAAYSKAKEDVSKSSKAIIFIEPDPNRLPKLIFKKNDMVISQRIQVTPEGFKCGGLLFKTIADLKENAPKADIKFPTEMGARFEDLIDKLKKKVG